MRLPRLLPLLFAAAACDSLPQGLEHFSGTFTYLAADSAGRPAFGGRLDLVVHPDSTITGRGDANPFRLRGGSNPVIGRVRGDSVHLWLDPNPDAGLFFDGVATDGGFRGSWWRNSIAGPQGGGAFFAQRSSDPQPAAP